MSDGDEFHVLAEKLSRFLGSSNRHFKFDAEHSQLLWCSDVARFLRDEGTQLFTREIQEANHRAEATEGEAKGASRRIFDLQRQLEIAHARLAQATPPSLVDAQPPVLAPAPALSKE